MPKIKPCYIVSIILFLMAIACFIGYRTIGVYIDEQGILHEPFGLIPCALICGVLSIVAVIAGLFKNKV